MGLGFGDQVRGSRIGLEVRSWGLGFEVRVRGLGFEVHGGDVLVEGDGLTGP